MPQSIMAPITAVAYAYPATYPNRMAAQSFASQTPSRKPIDDNPISAIRLTRRCVAESGRLGLSTGTGKLSISFSRITGDKSPSDYQRPPSLIVLRPKAVGRRAGD